MMEYNLHMCEISWNKLQGRFVEGAMKKLTHLDKEGRAKMVDVTEKPSTVREAIARGSVYMKPETLKLIQDKKIPKGDVFCVARVAGIRLQKKRVKLYRCVTR